MGTKNRVKNERVDIDASAVKSFFDNRHKKNLRYLYNYTNYQDNHPQLALKRDQWEKKVIEPLIDLRAGECVLDIGCGVGRWGKWVQDQGGIYFGIDYSQSLLDLAKAALPESDRCHWVCSSFQMLPQNMAQAGYGQQQFDKIFINGVFTYINDEEIPSCIQAADKLLKSRGRLYLREPVSREQRLTLNGIYSEELTSEYSAIYRSIVEYQAVWSTYLKLYKCLAANELWKQDLANRKETTAYYWIMEKTGD